LRVNYSNILLCRNYILFFYLPITHFLYQILVNSNASKGKQVIIEQSDSEDSDDMEDLPPNENARSEE